MAPKKDGGGGGAAWKEGEQRKLSAVVMADSYNERFMPITMDRPRCLLPLCGRPLVDYTLEFLVAGGVEEIFVFASAHSALIQEHIDQVQHALCRQVPVRVIVSEGCGNTGEALVEIQRRGIITDTFVLVTGDSVSNIDLKPIVEAHRSLTKESVMTMVLQPCSPKHRVRTMEEQAVFVLGEQDRRIHGYQPVVRGQKTFEVARSTFSMAGTRRTSLRHDLINTHISVCSPAVFQIFQENPDYYGTVSFAQGIISDDIMGNMVHYYEATNGYAARVTNLRKYQAVSHDIMHRWAFPVVPDSNLGPAEKYMHCGMFVYREDNVVLANSARLIETVLLGRGTTVGDRTTITETIISRRVTVGSDCAIKGSYLWNDVVVGDGVSISYSILAGGVTVKDGAQINKGCLLGYNVVVGKNFVLAPHTYLSCHAEDDPFSDFSDDDDELTDVEDEAEQPKQEKARDTTAQTEWDPQHVGEGGVGRLWTPDDDGDAEELGASMLTTWEETADDGGHDEEDDDDEEDDERTEDEKFLSEVTESIRRALEEGISTDNTALEIQSSIFAYNMSPSDSTNTIINALLSLVLNTGKEGTALLKELQKALGSLEKLLQKFVSQERDYKEALDTIMECCAEVEHFRPHFQTIVKLFYQKEIMDEVAFIVNWYEQKSHEVEGQVYRQLVLQVRPFVEWCNESDDEDTESE